MLTSRHFTELDANSFHLFRSPPVNPCKQKMVRETEAPPAPENQPSEPVRVGEAVLTRPISFEQDQGVHRRPTKPSSVVRPA
jgi:hypothetical protein